MKKTCITSALLKCKLNNNMLLLQNTHFKAFSSSNILRRKDYYAILGISKNADLSEIKKAYRSLAKKYHPDVSSSDKSDAQALEKFREVAEAYAVLSDTQSRSKYDVNFEAKPESVYSSEKFKNMEKAKAERDNKGNTPTEEIMKGSYADFELEKLKNFRKRFNFDDLGNYKGGVPRPHNGNKRGSALAGPLAPHSEFDHNEQFADFPSVKPVSQLEAIEHKHFHDGRREENLRFKPYFNIQEIEIDSQYEQTSENRKHFVIPVTAAIIYALYLLYNRLSLNKEYREDSRRLKDLKHHEYEVFGPVIIEAKKWNYAGKYLNRREFHAWLDNNLKSLT